MTAPQVSAGFDFDAQFRSVMRGAITFVGEDPIFPSVHRLGACIGIPIMAEYDISAATQKSRVASL
jgi:hypothetical protein